MNTPTAIVLAVFLVLLAWPHDTSVDRAIELCKTTGGEIRVVEYNDVGGITLNCVYPTDTAEFLENL